MDFGYTDPCAIVEIGILDHQYYVKEILYESGLTATQMLDRVKQLIPDRNALIYADSNRPEYIKELEETFYGIKGAEKGQGSVINGIDIVKKSKVFLDANSPNLLREARNYRKREVNGRILDDPVKNNDHTLDGLRYALMEHLEGTLPAGWL
jgi:phage terminase large subunit